MESEIQGGLIVKTFYPTCDQFKNLGKYFTQLESTEFAVKVRNLKTYKT